MALAVTGPASALHGTPDTPAPRRPSTPVPPRRTTQTCWDPRRRGAAASPRSPGTTPQPPPVAQTQAGKRVSRPHGRPGAAAMGRQGAPCPLQALKRSAARPGVTGDQHSEGRQVLPRWASTRPPRQNVQVRPKRVPVGSYLPGSESWGPGRKVWGAPPPPSKEVGCPAAAQSPLPSSFRQRRKSSQPA